MKKISWRILGSFLLGLATVTVASAQTLTPLLSFNFHNGESPAGGLVQGTDGNLYGTTEQGGTNAPGYGTIFRITPAGKVTTLHSFAGTDGAIPSSGLVQGIDGNFYGTTSRGGANDSPGTAGAGTVFKITTGGRLTTLYDFCAQPGCTDGNLPFSGLVQATNGSFYGTTQGGGANVGLNANGAGTVFEITSAGKLTTLYNFCAQPGCTDGFAPNGLIQATNGSFYGTTSDGADGETTIFKISPAGALTTLALTTGFTYAGLVQATDGNFYGTTGNSYGTSATVFKMTPGGKLTTLATVSGIPEGALIQATDGNFYGATTDGGTNAQGSIFQVTPAGTVMTLYSFCVQSTCDDGQGPSAGLLQDTNGTLYGTTAAGGTDAYGTVFSLGIGLGPFLATRPTSGPVGATVKILGTALTGATSVTFNGIAATFKVFSASEIVTTVPAGATTGTVQVTTPIATLSSNVAFRVP